MAGTTKLPLILTTTSHGFVTHVDFSAESILDIQNITRKLLGMALNQDFDLSCSLQFQSNRKWVDLASFDQLKEKDKIRLVDKATEKVMQLAGDAKNPTDWVGIHIANATIEGKVKGNAKFYLILSIGNKKDTPRFRTLSRSQPVWFENFVISIPEDTLKDGKINEDLTIKCYSETKPSGSEDLGKKMGVIEFNLNLLKKGEPFLLESSTKHFSLNAEVRWFSETRGFQAIAKREFHGMKGSLCSGARFYLPPPINAFGQVKKRIEQLWFRDITVLPNGLADLKKGDVLLKKSYGKKEGVILAQNDFVGSHGTKWTSHAAIVLEDKGLKVAEASESRDSVSISPTFPGGDFLVFRAADQDYAQAAADWAKEIATKHQIKYSHAGLSSSVISIIYDEAAKVRHKFLAEMKNLPKTMMAAQFVVAAYQCKVEQAYIELNSLFVSPMKLEEYINRNYSTWTFQGKLESHTINQWNEAHVPEDIVVVSGDESAEVTESLDSGSTTSKSTMSEPPPKKDRVDKSSETPSKHKDKVTKSPSKSKSKKKTVRSPREEKDSKAGQKTEKDNGGEEDPAKNVIFI